MEPSGERPLTLRTAQRQAVLQAIPDPNIRAAFHGGIPNDSLHPYVRSEYLTDDSPWARWNPEESFGRILLHEISAGRGAEFYRNVFGIAATAESPYQLANAFGVLGGVEAFVSHDSEAGVGDRVTQAVDSFLGSSVRPENPSSTATTFDRQQLREAEALLMAARAEIGRLSAYVAHATNQVPSIPPEFHEVLMYYRDFGGHPLVRLGIGTSVWSTMSPDERKDALSRAYKGKARELHYDKGRTDQGFDQQKYDLITAAFTQVTNAYNYLSDNLNRATFPEARIVGS